MRKMQNYLTKSLDLKVFPFLQNNWFEKTALRAVQREGEEETEAVQNSSCPGDKSSHQL